MALWNILRVSLAAGTIVGVAELSKRYPRYGALLLSLPLISVLAFLFSWMQHRDMAAISKMARETPVLVVLGLPFFLPFACAQQFGLGFWACLGLGIVLAAAAIGVWLAASSPH